MSYETLNDLLQQPNILVTEYERNYYVKVFAESQKYVGLYKVDKKTCHAYSCWKNIDNYMSDIVLDATRVELRKLKECYGIGEPEYDEDGIIVNANRHTLEGLLMLPYEFDVTEYRNCYYIAIVNPSKFDSTIYQVDKSIRKVSYMDLLTYMLFIEDKATPVDPETLRRAS